jgi:ferredoxin
MFVKQIVCLLVSIVVVCHAFQLFSSMRIISKSHLNMADVEVVFPNNKKVKVATGSSMKDAAKKAGYSPNYGCEEGKCGSCELKMNGKQKIRPCIGKVS